MANLYNPDTDWIAKEKRDMLFRHYISALINNKEEFDEEFDMEKTLDDGEAAVNEIFNRFPDKEKGRLEDKPDNGSTPLF